jgi:hypothetical protein
MPNASANWRWPVNCHRNSTRLPGGRMLFSCGTGKADRAGWRPSGGYMKSRLAGANSPVNLLLTLGLYELMATFVAFWPP